MNAAPPHVATAWARTAPAGLAREVLQRAALAPLVSRLVQITVHGREQLADLSGPVVFVANHSSHLDTPVILGALPRRFTRRTVVAAAADYFFQVWWRAASTALVMNTFPIERSGGKGTTTPSDLLRQGWNLLIYPEGTRSADGVIGPFKLGPAFLAVQCGLPVVPIALRGTYASMPRDQGWPAPGRLPVAIRFGAPVVPRPGETARQFGPRIREAVVRLVAEDAGTWWNAQHTPVPAPARRGPGGGNRTGTGAAGQTAPADRWRTVWQSSLPPRAPRRRSVWRR